MEANRMSIDTQNDWLAHVTRKNFQRAQRVKFEITPEEVAHAEAAAGDIPLPLIARTLFMRWLAGEIKMPLAALYREHRPRRKRKRSDPNAARAAIIEGLWSLPSRKPAEAGDVDASD
jgi:hypothetical protein